MSLHAVKMILQNLPAGGSSGHMLQGQYQADRKVNGDDDDEEEGQQALV